MAAAGTASGPEPMPSYAQLVQRGWGSALAAARGCADCGWGLARRGLAEHAHLAPPELLLLALCALGWTALRAAATARLFRVSAAGVRDVGALGWRAGMLGGSRTGPPGRSVSEGWGHWKVGGLVLEELGRGILGRRALRSVSAGWGWMRGCGRTGGNSGSGDPDTGRVFEM